MNQGVNKSTNKRTFLDRVCFPRQIQLLWELQHAEIRRQGQENQN